MRNLNGVAQPVCYRGVTVLDGDSGWSEFPLRAGFAVRVAKDMPGATLFHEPDGLFGAPGRGELDLIQERHDLLGLGIETATNRTDGLYHVAIMQVIIGVDLHRRLLAASEPGVPPIARKISEFRSSKTRSSFPRLRLPIWSLARFPC